MLVNQNTIMRGKTILRHTKASICSILNTDFKTLDCLLSEDAKKKVSWVKGRQYFTDAQTAIILKDFYQIATDAEIKNMIYPKGL